MESLASTAMANTAGLSQKPVAARKHEPFMNRNSQPFQNQPVLIGNELDTTPVKTLVRPLPPSGVFLDVGDKSGSLAKGAAEILERMANFRGDAAQSSAGRIDGQF